MIKKIIFLSVILFVSYFGYLKPLQLAFIDYLGPLIVFSRSSAAYLKDTFEFYQNLEKIRQENIFLKKQQVFLENWKGVEQISDEKEQEFRLLEQAIESDPFLKGRSSIVELIRYDLDSSLIYIRSKGVQVNVNDTVAYGRYLIGQVTSIKGSIAEVKPIFKQGELVSSILINKLGDKIKVNTFAENANQLVINNILSTELVEIGDLVYTSNSNDVFPSEMLIGQVDRVEGISSQAFRKGYLKRPFDLEKLSFLNVIRSRDD